MKNEFLQKVKAFRANLKSAKAAAELKAAISKILSIPAEEMPLEWNDAVHAALEAALGGKVERRQFSGNYLSAQILTGVDLLTPEQKIEKERMRIQEANSSWTY